MQGMLCRLQAVVKGFLEKVDTSAQYCTGVGSGLSLVQLFKLLLRGMAAAVEAHRTQTLRGSLQRPEQRGTLPPARRTRGGHPAGVRLPGA